MAVPGRVFFDPKPLAITSSTASVGRRILDIERMIERFGAGDQC